MNRVIPIGSFVLSCLFGSCLDSTSDDGLDVQAPAIGAPSTATTVAPGQFAELSADADRIPLAFAVSDDRGLSEIVVESHNGFDGHRHKTARAFALLSYRHTLTREDLTDPLYFESPANDELAIYLDDRNPAIPTDALVLAGPYHFSIRAADVSGNETTYADNSTYHTTLYLQRHYAPQVRVDAFDRAGGTVSGELWRNEQHEASADIVFVWAYITRPNPNHPAYEGDVQAEWLWGESNWPHQFRADRGEPLPGGTRIDLAKLLGDREAIRQMEPSDRLHLWVEDENGNITVRTY